MNRIFLLMVLALAACNESPTPVVSPAAPEPWVAVRPGEAASPLEVPARVIGGPGAVTWVTVPLRATVLKVHARVGDRVDAGAPLVEVVMPELLDAAGRAEGARVRLNAWAERLAQVTQLRADGLAKSLDVSEAAAKVAEMKAELHAARAVLLSAGLTEGDASRLLSGNGAFALRAAVAGVVSGLTVSVGENREPAGGPLAQLSSSGPVRVEARFQNQLGEGGGSAEFVAAGQSTPLTLISRAPNADARDGTFLAWFEPNRPLAAGLLGRVVFHGSTGLEPLRVPAQAIARNAGAATLETRRGPVNIEVVRCEGADCLVRGALSLDDEVRLR